MDARKAIFRAKLRESSQHRAQRIESPLVRYNELDQPICRVCNVVLKSESLWPSHQASRRHHEAAEKLKAAAVGVQRGKSLNHKEPTETQNHKLSAPVPEEFFENKGIKRQRIGGSAGEAPVQSSLTNDGVVSVDGKEPLVTLVQPPEQRLPETSTRDTEAATSNFKQPKTRLPASFFDGPQLDGTVQGQKSENVPGTKQSKGELPEGFFDNKDADLRARGIEPVKVDVKDAYKEFEKEIQSNLQDVDNRLEEEEIDAAEEMEGFLNLEQREYRKKVEMVKQKLLSVKAARLTRANQKPAAIMSTESSDDDESTSDNDDDDDVNVDWRAQHL